MASYVSLTEKAVGKYILLLPPLLARGDSLHSLFELTFRRVCEAKRTGCFLGYKRMLFRDSIANVRG